MKYRKKPVVIDAIQWNGENFQAISESLREDPIETEKSIQIKTLEGNHILSVGDYIIKGIKGEFYPCKPDIFEKTYEQVI